MSDTTPTPNQRPAHLRVVMGKIVDIVEGDYNIYATEGKIINNAATNFVQVGVDNGVKYQTPSTEPTPIVFAKLAIEFRPNKSWQGEFGFDWARKADSKMPVDNKYSKVVGEYGDIYATKKGAVFTPSTKSYKRLLREYQSLHLYNGKYYIPSMTLLEGKTAVLDIVTSVDEVPDKIHYAFDQDIFEVTILKKITKSKGKNYDEKALQIKCKKKFSTQESIRVIASKDRKMQKVGQINILPNSNIKNIDVLFIPVEVELSGGIVSGKIKGNEEIMLSNALNQAYIKPKISRFPTRLKANGFWFNWNFITKDKKGNEVMDVSIWSSLHAALEDRFFAKNANAKYKNHYRVYMLPTSLDLGGVAEGIGNTKVVAVFQNRDPSTVAHEIMHAMGLYHTFDNDSEFTFKINATDNVMDYTHQIGKDRFSTNKFQWKKLNSHVR